MATHPIDDDRLTLAGLLFEASSSLGQRLERGLREHSGLSTQWFELLLRLARSPDHQLRMSDLAAQTALTPSGLTRAIDRLVGEGLVERTSCDTDRRGSYARLTPQGLERVTAAVIPHLDDIDDCLVAPLEKSERAMLEGLLRKIRDHVRPGAEAGSHA